jgi:hypothetical protein
MESDKKKTLSAAAKAHLYTYENGPGKDKPERTQGKSVRTLTEEFMEELALKHLDDI